jgi:hypothetical protein
VLAGLALVLMAVGAVSVWSGRRSRAPRARPSCR